MSNNPQIFHGEWWVPALLDPDMHSIYFDPKQAMGQETKYKGTLTYYEDKDSTLELFHYPSHFMAKLYQQNDVIWGIDANGHIFTLFNVAMKDQHLGDFTTSKFIVNLILIGDHVLSANDTRFNRCVVQFPYLRNWAFQDQITKKNEDDSISFSTQLIRKKLLDAASDKGVYWSLWQYPTIDRTIHDLTITQTTEFEIEATTPCSIWTYLKQIEEFSQFLSISLYCNQDPIKIEFEKKGNTFRSILLFRKEKSEEPEVTPLIKYQALSDKLPTMLNLWHTNFENVAPISNYLISSLHSKNRFDVPDFLIIAQALDGYHKRFVNKRNGKDHRKYEDGIKILLKQFKDVECIKKLHIDPIVLRDSRDKYSHLYPDDEKSLAVKGGELYWLTEKCKILLTCCILNLLGLSNNEINLCCENSPISRTIDSVLWESED